MKNSKILVSSLLVAMVAFSYAQSTTLSWRATYLPTDDWYPYQIAADAAGNVYVVGADQNPLNYTLHLRKFDPLGRPIFSTDIAPDPSWIEGIRQTALLVSPPNNGAQYIYICTIGGATLNAPDTIRITKVSTAGQVLSSSPLIQGTTGNRFDLCGSYVDTLGNVYLAVAYKSNAIPPTPTLRMLKVDGDGNVVSDQFNHDNLVDGCDWGMGDINADCTTTFYHSAIYDPIRQRWLAEGYDPSNNTGGSFGAARWGIYDPSTGHEDYHETTYGVRQTVVTRFMLSLLPGGNLAVASNWSFSNGGPYIAPSHGYRLKILNADNSVKWAYPASGYSNGFVFQVLSKSTSDPIYLSGTVADGYSTSLSRFLEQFDWSGNKQLHLDHQPAESLFAAPQGFNSFCLYDNDYPGYQGGMGANDNCSFLEHFDGATWDWGVKFQDFPVRAPGRPFGFVPCGDSFYTLTYVDEVPPPYPPYWIYLDRYVQGTFVNSIAAPASVQQNHAVAVTVAINSLAGHYGYPFGLFSNNAALLMPNGTRSQNFRIPAGQKSMTVSLTAGSVAANTTVTLLATQNGVKRTTATTITP